MSTLIKYILLFLTLSVDIALAWDGVDLDKDESITIEQGTLVRSGREIEYYNHDDGNYHLFEVDSITRIGSSVILEGTDSDTGEDKTLEMEDNR